MKKAILLFLIVSVFSYGCAQQQSKQLPINISPVDSFQNLEWRTVPLTDVRTGAIFTISNFKGKPVLVESFAIWCPVCTKQQQEIKKLHEEVGDGVVSISLDTDPWISQTEAL